ncbi:MAG TPA: hypothetical protein VGR89_12290 [Puia sp.]|nr:hypothetical protein [Puia sp.]
MKKNQLIAISALSVVLAATTVYLIRKNRQNQRKKVVANAGYEMAYDIHYPMKYSNRRRPAAG